MFIAATGIHLLFRTLRYRTFYSRSDTSPYLPVTGATYTYCVWHDSLIIPLFAGRQPNTMAVVSQHGDGNWIALLLKALKIRSVRGSSSKGGANAMRQILEQGQSGHFVLTPDGPRGPRRKMKAGVSFLASRAGKAVVPTAFSCSRAWYIGTGWTDLMLPMPFSKIYLITGTPIEIPVDARREELDAFSQQIEDEMFRLNARADRLAKGLPDEVEPTLAVAV